MLEAAQVAARFVGLMALEAVAEMLLCKGLIQPCN